MATTAGCHGYYRFPSLHSDTLAFVSEDDIWLTSTSTSGLASRLTSDGRCSHPAISPNGQWIAYSSDRASPGHCDVWLGLRIAGRCALFQLRN